MDATQGLRAHGLRRAFGHKEALSGLDLVVPPGTCTAVLGPNGSGKSTSLKVLAGVARPDGGTASFNGVNLHDGVAFKRQLGYVPDVGGLFPRLTGYEHLELVARVRGLRDWQQRAEDLLDELGLGDFADERTQAYSHGTSRKLSAAAALLPRSPLLLLDEPFDGVDPLGVEALTSLFRGAVQEGASVVLVTHLVALAGDLADHVVVLQGGRTLASAPRGELAPGAVKLEDAYRHLLRRSL
jgi:ABC-2 type transport system ATP-binding protein